MIQIVRIVEKGDPAGSLLLGDRKHGSSPAENGASLPPGSGHAYNRPVPKDQQYALPQTNSIIRTVLCTSHPGSGPCGVTCARFVLTMYSAACRTLPFFLFLSRTGSVPLHHRVDCPRISPSLRPSSRYQRLKPHVFKEYVWSRTRHLLITLDVTT